MSKPPPPPPPEGFEGVYPPQTAANAPNAAATAANMLSTGFSFAKKATAVVGSKMREVDDKFELSKKSQQAVADISEAAAPVAAQAKGKLSELGKKGAEKGAEVKTAAARKVGVMTPEERQRWLDGAVSVVAVASVFGGAKTKAVAGLAGVGLSAYHSNNPPQPAASTSAAAASRSSAASAAGGGSIAEVLEVEVVATVPGGQVMRVHVENVGAFEVTVPAGVSIPPG